MTDAPTPGSPEETLISWFDLLALLETRHVNIAPQLRQFLSQFRKARSSPAAIKSSITTIRERNGIGSPVEAPTTTEELFSLVVSTSTDLWMQVDPTPPAGQDANIMGEAMLYVIETTIELGRVYGTPTIATFQQFKEMYFEKSAMAIAERAYAVPTPEPDEFERIIEDARRLNARCWAVLNTAAFSVFPANRTQMVDLSAWKATAPEYGEVTLARLFRGRQASDPEHRFIFTDGEFRDVIDAGRALIMEIKAKRQRIHAAFSTIFRELGLPEGHVISVDYGDTPMPTFAADKAPDTIEVRLRQHDCCGVVSIGSDSEHAHQFGELFAEFLKLRKQAI